MPSHGQLESDPLAGDEKYEMIKQLGRGAFGSVVLAKEKDTGQLVCTAHCSLSSHCMHPHCVCNPLCCARLYTLGQTRVCAAQIALVRTRTSLLFCLLCFWWSLAPRYATTHTLTANSWQHVLAACHSSLPYSRAQVLCTFFVVLKESLNFQANED